MKHIQFIGMGLAESDAYVGYSREVTVVTDTGELRVHDGVTPGGHKIPTDDQISGFSVLRFNALATTGVPGNLAASSQDKLTKITLAGTYNLPLLADINNVGGPVILKAMVASVNIGVQGADLIEAGTLTNLTTIAMVEGEIVEFAKLSAALYIVTNRFVP